MVVREFLLEYNLICLEDEKLFSCLYNLLHIDHPQLSPNSAAAEIKSDVSDDLVIMPRSPVDSLQVIFHRDLLVAVARIETPPQVALSGIILGVHDTVNVLVSLRIILFFRQAI